MLVSPPNFAIYFDLMSLDIIITPNKDHFEFMEKDKKKFFYVFSKGKIQGVHFLAFNPGPVANYQVLCTLNSNFFK